MIASRERRFAAALALALAAPPVSLAQSVLVADLQRKPRAPLSSSPSSGVRFGNLAVFAAEDELGAEPWVTDGTAAGTRRLMDIDSGSGGSFPGYFVDAGFGVVFAAHDECAGSEPWVTDGTPEGTRRLADILPGSEGSGASSFVAWNGIALFAAGDEANGAQLWRTDGTEAGTVRVTDPIDGVAVQSVLPMSVAIDDGVFVLRDEGGFWTLWISDGTREGTRRVWAPPAGGTAEYGGRALDSRRAVVTIDDGVHGPEPWITDGTAAGTLPLADTFDGNDPWSPKWLGVVGGRAVFTVGNYYWHGLPWSTDGTPAGTQPLAPEGTEWTTSLGLGPDGLWVAGDDEALPSLWTTDGTPQGTVLRLQLPRGDKVRHGRTTDLGTFLARSSGTVSLFRGSVLDLATGSGALSVQSFIALPGQVVFAHSGPGGEGLEPWRSDGTIAGTRLIADLRMGELGWGCFPTGLADTGHGLLFGASTFGARQAWITDGTASGTVVLAERGPTSSFPGSSSARLSSALLFTDEVNALHATDGTVAGTREILPATLRVSWGSFAVMNDRAYFKGTDGTSGTELWVSDGTAAGTHVVKEIAPGSQGSWPEDLTVAGGRLWFAAHDGTSGVEPWVSDGTEAGTRRVKDVVPGAAGSWPVAFGALGDRVVTFLEDDVHGTEPWISDGTEAGTTLIADLTPSVGGTWPEAHVTLAGLFLFTSWRGTSLELWATDGTATGTRRIATLSFDPGDAAAAGFVVMGGRACFLVGDDLWRTDGTPEGTWRILEDAVAERSLSVIDDRLLFASPARPPGGSEPWISDGTPEGTHRIEDLNPGDASSAPGPFVASGDRIFFGADDGRTGPELRWYPRALLRDADLDGVPDERDDCRWDFDPLQADTDGDGHADGCDACARFFDPQQEDADCDRIGDACDFAWGDVAPSARPDGRVDVSDAVRLLRIAVGLESADADVLRRGNVAPVELVAATTPPVVRPQPGAAEVIDVADAVIALRASVGLVSLQPPR